MARPRRYEVQTGAPITVEVHGEDGVRLVIAGVLDAVPLSAGNIAQKLVIRQASPRPMRADET